MSKRVIVAGGGASGMMAALVAAKNSENEVMLCEKNSRVGKKLLATGNGRCNLTNIDCGVENYRGRDPEFAMSAIKAFDPEAVIKFFEGIGLVCKVTRGGRVFPYCEQSSAVLDILRIALAREGVELRTNCEVTAAEKLDGGFEVLAAGERLGCDRLVIATGGKAAPSTGSDGGGLRLLAGFGHEIITPYPALHQLKTDGALAKGVRLNGRAVVKEKARADGEIQFTDYGLSGPAVMEVSAEALAAGHIELDLLPHMGKWELIDALTKRKELMGHLTAEDFLTGFIHKRAGQALLKRAGVKKLSLPVSELDGARLERLAHTLKHLAFTVRGHTGWELAQATGGGADTAGFDSNTMESLTVSGLFATGEALDIYGGCGGYNLQWAWASGYAAGRGSCLRR